MRVFTYTPNAYKVAETYQNYSNGGPKQILNENDVVQFKNDTDRAFQSVQEVLVEHQNELYNLRTSLFALQAENKAAFKALAWIEHNYPEAMRALECTMKATVVLDKANGTSDEVMEAP